MSTANQVGEMNMKYVEPVFTMNFTTGGDCPDALASNLKRFFLGQNRIMS